MTDRRLDWLVVLTSAWMVGGAWLDVWSHHKSDVESFFTPVHGVLYAGYLATAAVLALSSLRRAGGRLALRPPAGYRPAVIGIPLFLIGGVGDSIWHTIFGIEQDLDALLSPTHLILGVGAALMVSGPLVAAWHRSRAESAGPGLAPIEPPAVIALALLVSVVSFFTAFANPFGLPLAAGARLGQLASLGVEQDVEGVVRSGLLGQALGVASVLMVAGIVVPAILFVVLQWRLLRGTLALVFVIGLGPSALPHEILVFVLVALAAGLATDALAVAMRPTLDRPGAVALLSVLGPGVLLALYFAAIQLTVGIAWPLELWTGSVLLAGGVGLALALLVLSVAPSRAPR